MGNTAVFVHEQMALPHPLVIQHTGNLPILPSGAHTPGGGWSDFVVWGGEVVPMLRHGGL